MNRTTTAHREAFTLLEILLVVLVIAIAVGAFLPTGLNTVDQARTRSFLRQVIALNKYARSRAVLDVASMNLMFDPEQGVIELQPVSPAVSPSGPTEEPLTEKPEAAPPVLQRRKVPRTMRIREIEGAVERDGVYWVTIESDGVGPSYELEIIDPRGEPRRLHFNGFTGEVDEVE